MKLIFIVLLATCSCCSSQQFFPIFIPYVAPVGEVVLVTNLVESDNFSGPFGVTNLSDGNFSTFWNSANTKPGWISIDAGTSVVPTRYIFGTRGDLNAASLYYENRATGSIYYASSVQSFNSGITNFDSIPAFPFPNRNIYHYRTIAAGTNAYRYFMLSNNITGGFGGNWSELRFLVQQGVTTNAKPVTPAISPWGGHYQTSNAIVTLTTTTTGSTIYFTTNGTTPTTSSLQYSGPFNLTILSNTVLEAMAYNQTLLSNNSEIATATFHNYSYGAGDALYDNDGNIMWTFGGCVVTNGGYFYRTGQFLDVAQLNTSDISGIPTTFLYKSLDGICFTNLGQILQTPTPFQYMERQKILCLSPTNYVLWGHGINFVVASNTSWACVAISTNIEAGWSWAYTNLNPDGFGFKDFNTYSEAGTNYIIYVNGLQTASVISQLTPSGTSTTGAFTIINSGMDEAPCMMIRSTVRFLVYSLANYYNSLAAYSPVYIIQTNEIAGPLGFWPNFSSATAVYPTDPLGTVYNAQPQQIISTPTGFILASDKWGSNNLAGSSEVFVPLKFTATNFLQAVYTNNWNTNALTP